MRVLGENMAWLLKNWRRLGPAAVCPRHHDTPGIYVPCGGAEVPPAARACPGCGLTHDDRLG